MKKEKKYNYFYRIENKINGHYYYGIHSTDNLNDGYMGSGKRLQMAYDKYGVENFEKTILKYFANRKELSLYESEMVTESLINDDNCYNIILGGEHFNTIGYTSCYDKILKEKLLVKTEIYKNDDRYISTHSGNVVAKRIGDDKWGIVKKEEYRKNKTLYETPNNNKVVVKNSKNEFFSVDKDDERIKNGELKYHFAGIHHTEETKKKISETKIKNKSQRGEKNSQYGTCWVHNDIKSIKIKKEFIDEYLNNGWVLGRKMFKKVEYKNSKVNNINIEDFKNDYLINGFSIKQLSEKYKLTYTYTSKLIQRKIKNLKN